MSVEPAEHTCPTLVADLYVLRVGDAARALSAAEVESIRSHYEMTPGEPLHIQVGDVEITQVAPSVWTVVLIDGDDVKVATCATEDLAKRWLLARTPNFSQYADLRVEEEMGYWWGQPEDLPEGGKRWGEGPLMALIQPQDVLSTLG